MPFSSSLPLLWLSCTQDINDCVSNELQKLQMKYDSLESIYLLTNPRGPEKLQICLKRSKNTNFVKQSKGEPGENNYTQFTFATATPESCFHNRLTYPLCNHFNFTPEGGPLALLS